MKKLYVASGYDSWVNKRQLQAFDDLDKAKAYLDGLTAPQMQTMEYKTKNDLITTLLKGAI